VLIDELKAVKSTEARKRGTVRYFGRIVREHKGARSATSENGGLLTSLTRQRVVGTFYEARLRKRQQLVAANINRTSVVGSGTAALKVLLDPLPGGFPKFARQVVY
jgi:hypothetical protein